MTFYKCMTGWEMELLHKKHGYIGAQFCMGCSDSG